MPTNTYTPIASVTLSATASEVVFTGLPQTFRDLIVVMSGGFGGGTNGDALFSFNGDTGSNYSRVFAVGTGSTAFSGTSATANWWTMDNSDNNNSILHILDYSATNKHKTVLSRSNNFPGLYTLMMAGRWANTAAINSIALSAPLGNIRSGSVISIFGIAG